MSSLFLPSHKPHTHATLLHTRISLSYITMSPHPSFIAMPHKAQLSLSCVILIIIVCWITGPNYLTLLYPGFG